LAINAVPNLYDLAIAMVVTIDYHDEACRFGVSGLWA
jgi:hypothetical protein